MFNYCKYSSLSKTSLFNLVFDSKTASLQSISLVIFWDNNNSVVILKSHLSQTRNIYSLWLLFQLENYRFSIISRTYNSGSINVSCHMEYRVSSNELQIDVAMDNTLGTRINIVWKYWKSIMATLLVFFFFEDVSEIQRRWCCHLPLKSYSAK